MRQIELTKIGQELAELVNEAHPVDEDIGIFDNQGNLCAVVITKEAYAFFLDKIEKEEDALDIAAVAEFERSNEK